MAGIQYIKDGIGQMAVAEKIKLLKPLEDNLVNPFLRLVVTPDSSEALISGGGVYIFYKVLGYPAALRRDKAPMGMNVKYDGTTAVEKITLTISEPFETLRYPYQSQDTLMIDGLAIPTRMVGKIQNTLDKAKRKEMTKAIIYNDKAHVGQGAGKSILDELLEIRMFLANYLDLTANNDFWSDKERSLFDSLEGYALKPFIYMNPLDVVDFSAINTMAQAGSVPQFMSFEDGVLKSIIGFEVISTPLVPSGKIYAAIECLGVPDEKIMSEKVFDYYDPTTDTNIVWGKRWFNTINVFGEFNSVWTRTEMKNRDVFNAPSLENKMNEVVSLEITDKTAIMIGKAFAKEIKLNELAAAKELENDTDLDIEADLLKAKAESDEKELAKIEKELAKAEKELAKAARQKLNNK